MSTIRPLNNPRRIEYFRVTIEPWMMAENSDSRLLKLEIQVNGEKYGSQVVLRPDDITSRLDYIWMAAKQELMNALLGVRQD